MTILMVLKILILLVCMATSQKICVQTSVPVDGETVDGEYERTGVTLDGNYNYYVKTTTETDTREILLYVFEDEGSVDSQGNSLENNWYFTLGLDYLDEDRNPWVTNINDILAYCRKPNSITTPIDCEEWWDRYGGQISITAGACPTPEPTKAPTKAPTWPGVEPIVLDDAIKEHLEDDHNRCRSKLAKGDVVGRDDTVLFQAAKMYPVVWDETIASSAQQWANKCVHDHPRDPAIYAENLMWGDQYVWLTATIDAWDIEHKNYKYGEPMDSDPDSPFFNGHFLNVIFEPHTRIGCAIAKCPNSPYKDDPRIVDDHWIVCRYGTNGEDMDIDTTPYVRAAEAGDQCPDGVDRETGLCL